MFKLIEFALLCSCSKHNNSICRNNKIQTFSQKILHVRKYSGAHKILGMRFLCFDKCFFSNFLLVKLFVLPFDSRNMNCNSKNICIQKCQRFYEKIETIT